MMDKTPQPHASRTQAVIACVLTVIFLVFAAGFGLYGILSDPASVYNSVRFHKAKSYLADPEDTSFFPMTQARIASLENRLGKTLPFTDELEILNSTFSYALGKDMVVEGSDQMLRLENGQLYNLTTAESLSDSTQDIIDLYNYIDGEIPFLFSYVHPGFFNGGMELPDGYAAIDTSDEIADELLATLNDAGIETLDSRTFFEGTGFTNDDLMFKTDKHWTNLAALLASQIYAESINRISGAELDLSKLQLDQFTSTTYEDLFFGDSGQLVGLNNADPEDITIYLPTYEADLTRHSQHRAADSGLIEDVSGSFEEVIVRTSYLERADNGYSDKAHAVYGLIEQFEQLTNNGGDCEDMTILVLRDSYTAPVCSFLSLVVENIVSADLRYGNQSVVELIDTYQPDMIIVSYSRYMLINRAYNFNLPE